MIAAGLWTAGGCKLPDSININPGVNVQNPLGESGGADTGSSVVHDEVATFEVVLSSCYQKYDAMYPDFQANFTLNGVMGGIGGEQGQPYRSPSAFLEGVALVANSFPNQELRLDSINAASSHAAEAVTAIMECLLSGGYLTDSVSIINQSALANPSLSEFAVRRSGGALTYLDGKPVVLNRVGMSGSRPASRLIFRGTSSTLGDTDIGGSDSNDSTPGDSGSSVWAGDSEIIMGFRLLFLSGYVTRGTPIISTGDVTVGPPAICVALEDCQVECDIISNPNTTDYSCSGCNSGDHQYCEKQKGNSPPRSSSSGNYLVVSADG